MPNYYFLLFFLLFFSGTKLFLTVYFSTDHMIVFYEKVLVLCRSTVYPFFCRDLNSLQDGENSIYITPIVLPTIIPVDIFWPKFFTIIYNQSVLYKFSCHFIFVFWYIYIHTNVVWNIPGIWPVLICHQHFNPLNPSGCYSGFFKK